MTSVVTKLRPRLASKSKCLAASDKSRVQGRTTNARSSALAAGRTSVRTDGRGRVTEQPSAPTNATTPCPNPLPPRASAGAVFYFRSRIINRRR
jgi:hypothetical protein